MILEQQHSIQQLCFEVEFPDQSEVISFQNQISDLARNSIKSILDETLSKYSEDKIITIDFCELDLGIIPKNDFKSKLLEKIEQRLNELFSDILGGTAYYRQNVSGVNIISHDQHFINDFSHYLVHGYLPWNVAEKWTSDNFFKQRIKELLDTNSPELKSIVPFLSSIESRERFARIAGDEITGSFLKQLLTSSTYQVITEVFNKLHALIQQTLSLSGLIKSLLTNSYNGYVLRIIFKIQTLSMVFDQPLAVNEFISFLSEDKKLTPEKWIMPILHEVYLNRASSEGVYQILQAYFVKKLEDRPLLISNFYGDFNEESFAHWLNTTRPEIAEDIIAFVKKTIDKVMLYFPSVKRERIARLIQLRVAEWLPEIRRGSVPKGLLNDIIANTEQIFLLSPGMLSVDQKVSQPKAESSKRLLMRQHIITFFKIGIQLLNVNESNSSETIEKIVLQYAKAYPDDFNALVENNADASPLLFWHIRQVFSAEAYKKFKKSLSSGKHKKLSDEPYEWLLLRHVARTSNISWTVLLEGQKPVYQTLQKFLQQDELQFIQILKEEKATETHKAERLSDEKLSVKEKLSEEIARFIDQVKASQIKPEEEKKIKIIDKLSIQLMEFLRGIHAEADFGGKGYFYALIRQAAMEMPIETSALLLSLSRADVTHLHSIFTVEQKEIVTRLIQKYNQIFKVSEEPDAEQKDEKSTNLTEPIYIFNAGLVLLNPFLARLFDKSGLIENKAFKTEEHRLKAMILLHYLATGQDNPSEHELVFNKIITGEEPSAQVELNITLSQEEKDLCDSLLDAAISNWTALKKTSRDNLRGSFLLREGKLLFEQEGWRLSLEQKAYDILIDRLPWGYSLMKYQWMKYPIYTEWR
jgi:hypothetical protein